MFSPVTLMSYTTLTGCFFISLPALLAMELACLRHVCPCNTPLQPSLSFSRAASKRGRRKPEEGMLYRRKGIKKNWLSLKICFYGSAKTGQKIIVCMMENKGSVAKMIKKRDNKSMLTSKLHFLLNILAPC